jgi:type III restriction enzyme
VTLESIVSPILNGPYDPPAGHFELANSGGITGIVLPGRRPSESFIPLPAKKKGKSAQAELNFDVTGERIEENSLINDIRREVELWRARKYPGVTPYSRKLLQHWADESREDRVLFCQREAAETAIFLAEVAGRHGTADYRSRLDEQNRLHNQTLDRVALKMATGSGKTIVMAMLIAWQTINKVFLPRDARFTKRFLVVTPGITIRDRLRVLRPEDDGNYFRERDLVPADLWGALREAEIVIVNYHAFLLRDTKEIAGVAKNTRKLLTVGKKVDPFKETPDQMVSRVLRDFIGRGKGEVLVLNDEAHHCYVNKPLEDDAGLGKADKEAKQRNEDARVWFRGLIAVKRKLGIKAIYDLSATPFYLSGSGYNEGFIFPWTVSDFSLMDAIESGIVKVPRLPVNDDSTNKEERLVYLHLWDTIGEYLPKSGRKRSDEPDNPKALPPALTGALHSLYDSYSRAFARWEENLAELGEPPPVMIVVCPNTRVSKLVFDWIGGYEIEVEDTKRRRVGELALLSNVHDGDWIKRPRTILIDSAQLESGESLKDDFKKVVASEIETFKTEYRTRNPGADADALTDEDLLREVMNTVGKKGKLGEQVRCVVSVSMLTEGWDANTVTHILGVRAFRSRLLCEQVVGRALRRRSYAINEQGRFEPEYAEVYGVPFEFIPTDRPVGEDKPPPPAIHVHAIDQRAELRIVFPKLDGYRLEIPDERFFDDFDDSAAGLRVTKEFLPTWTRTEGVAGEGEEQSLTKVLAKRPQEVAYEIAAELVRSEYTGLLDDPKPWLFPQLVKLTKEWLTKCVTYDEGCEVGLLSLGTGLAHASETMIRSVLKIDTSQEDPLRDPSFLRPVLRRFDPEGATENVNFMSRKPAVEAVKSHVSHVVLDGPSGTNTWEQRVAELCEVHPEIHSFVKNDHLGLEIPYVFEGVSHRYLPDFVIRLNEKPGDVERTLIVEVSGSRKAPGPTKAKAETARDQWCRAVNNDGRWGRWGYIEIKSKDAAESDLNAAIHNLYSDGPITGMND